MKGPPTLARVLPILSKISRLQFHGVPSRQVFNACKLRNVEVYTPAKICSASSTLDGRSLPGFLYNQDAMSIRAGLGEYYRCFGLGGVLALCASRVVGRPREIMGQPSGIRHPVHIRTRTTAPSAYAEVLLDGEYAFDLPFSPKTIVDAGANIGLA